MTGASYSGGEGAVNDTGGGSGGGTSSYAGISEGSATCAASNGSNASVAGPDGAGLNMSLVGACSAYSNAAGSDASPDRDERNSSRSDGLRRFFSGPALAGAGGSKGSAGSGSGWA